MNSFGSNLKRIRKEKKFSQKALAERVGVGQTTIANYENDQRYPNPIILSRLASILQVSLDLLLRGQTTDPLATTNPSLDQEVFIDLIRNFDDQEAMDMVLGQVKAGYDVIDLYYGFIKPVMYRVGDLWLRGELSVPMEHHITHVIDKLLVLLSDYIQCGPPKDKKAIFIAPGSESHLLGLKIVKETFRRYGWKTFFVGRSVPWKSLVDMINQVGIDLVVISTTIENNLNQVESLVGYIRRETQAKILLGGQAYNKHHAYVRQIKPDYYPENQEQLFKLIHEI